MGNESARLYLSPPHLGEWERLLVEEAFRDNWIAPLGPHVDAFEQEVAQYTGCRGALALSSGTAAIHLALKLLDVAEGDTVFCSSLTFVASANPILYQKAIPIFIDSEPESWNMSPQALERALHDAHLARKLPKAVIVVNLYGQSSDMGPIRDLCQRYGVPVVEDAAESLGATYKGKASGTFGEFGIFSFNGNKIITTSGGGMLVSDNREALDKARYWATQARDPARHYQHSETGYNYRMSNVLAAIGRGQFKVLEERIRQRRNVFDFYYKRLAEIEGVTFMPEASFGQSTRWLTALTVDPDRTGVSSSDIVDFLASHNIEARPVWKPLHLQPLFRHCFYYPHTETSSVSDRLFECGLCLPSGSQMTENDQIRVIDLIAHSLKTAVG